jgi:hypothetical protein
LNKPILLPAKSQQTRLVKMPTRLVLEMKGSLFADRLPCITIVIKAMKIRSAITLPLVERFIICINEGFSKRLT